MRRYPGMITIQRSSASIKTLQSDICVVGSGAAGLSAALEARQLKESVILVEGAPQFGGQAVGSVIGTICGLYSNGPNPYRVTHGVMDGLLQTMTEQGISRPRRARNTVIMEYSVNAWMRWAETEVVNQEIQPLLGAILRTVHHKNGRVQAVGLATRWGDIRVEARNFIDASGDAVIPWLADLSLNQTDEKIYGTVMAVFENVDTEICADYSREKYHEAMRRRADEFGLVRFDGFIFPTSEEGKVLLNMTHIETPLDPIHLSLAGIEGRNQVDGLLALFRSEFPEAFGKARVGIYGQPGVRQTRTIQGRSRLTVEDVISGNKPSDAVVRCSWPIELHTQLEEAHWEVFDENHMHYVPFGAMVPEGLENVVVAGRCIDAEPAALASVRVMGPCFAMGRAAATAAHLVGEGSLHQFDLPALQIAIQDNLELNVQDPWLQDLVSETGPEANG